MQSWYQHILIFLEHYGVLGLFILSFVEASFFPLPPYLLLIPMVLAAPQFGLGYATVATLGSVLGGILGYVIGLKVGWPILSYIMRPPALNKLEVFFHRFGGWTVTVGGLTPIPYKIFAITAGVFRMQVITFVATSIIARSIHFFSGSLLLIFFGKNVVGFLKHSFDITKLIILGITVIIGFILWHTGFIRRKLDPIVLKIWDYWLVMVNKVNYNIQTVSRFGWYLVTGGTLTIFGFGLFVKIGRELFEHELIHFDGIIRGFVLSVRTPWLSEFMRGITNFGSTPVLVVITVSLTILGLVYRRFLLDVLVLDTSAGGALVITEILKMSFRRQRPPLPWLSTASGFSFPSGHTVLTLSLYGFLAYLMIRNRPFPKWGKIFSLLFLILAGLVGISRIYLGVHFPSDVLAGWAVAVAWLGTCIAGREILYKANINIS